MVQVDLKPRSNAKISKKQDVRYGMKSEAKTLKRKSGEKYNEIETQVSQLEKIINWKWGKSEFLLPRSSFYYPYGTLFVGEYDFLRPDKGDIVIDAGANIGDYTLKICNKVSKVIAIEPDVKVLGFLHTNTQRCKNVIVVERALGGLNETINIAKNGIKVDTIDNIVEDLKLQPTILKMDIEGYEGVALEGMIRSIASIKRAVLEIHNNENKTVCEKILKENGFKIRYQSNRDVFRRIAVNIFTHPLSFISYEIKNKFYALRMVYQFLFFKRSIIPGCGQTPGMYMLEAWK